MTDSSDDDAGGAAASDMGASSTTDVSGEQREGGDGGGEDASGAESVAAKAGIEEAVLDTPRTLEPRVRVQWILRSTFGAVVLGIIAGVAAFIVGRETTLLAEDVATAATVAGGVFVFGTVYGVVRALLLYRSWEYVVRADSLYLSRGVFTRVRTVVPYVRVQHIDTTRNPVERLLGLSTLVVYTAGSRGADVTIPGLTPDGASTLQRRLKRLAIESEEEDAV